VPSSLDHALPFDFRQTRYVSVADPRSRRFLLPGRCGCGHSVSEIRIARDLGWAREEVAMYWIISRIRERCLTLIVCSLLERSWGLCYIGSLERCCRLNECRSAHCWERRLGVGGFFGEVFLSLYTRLGT